MSVAGAQPSAADRLSRLLAMVPWLLQRPGVDLGVAAAHFAITPEQMVRDLELLFVCGTPGHLPDDLIEADWEDGAVTVRNADALARPLRLGMDEALALLAGLRTLLEVPGAGDRDALTGALAKLSEAAGDAASAARALRVDLGAPAPAGDTGGDGAAGGGGGGGAVLATAREALRTRTRLRLRYLVPSRDETTERDVDPMRVLAVEGRWYLEGWCHRAGGVRLFRLDRVVSAEATGQDGTPPPEAVAREVDDGLFTPSPDDLLVTLRLEPGARWVAEQVPTEEVVELARPPAPGRPGAPGPLLVRLRTADTRWLRRLLLPLGGDARVLHPASLAAEVAADAAAALAAHGAAPA